MARLCDTDLAPTLLSSFFRKPATVTYKAGGPCDVCGKNAYFTVV